MPLSRSVQFLFKGIKLPEELSAAFKASVRILFSAYRMCPFSLNTASDQSFSPSSLLPPCSMSESVRWVREKLAMFAGEMEKRE